MIDYSKRNTLKAIAVASGTVAAGGISSAALSARSGNQLKNNAASDYPQLGQIEVATRVSVISNDLEVVLTNTGNESVVITQMTPRVVRVARGEFDFTALLKDGPLHLDAGASVSVPMQHKAMRVGEKVASLNDALKNTLSVITDSNSFASVSIKRVADVTSGTFAA